MNRDNKGRPGFKTLDGWGTDLDTRRLKVTDPSVSGLSETVETMTTDIRIMEEQNVLSDLESQYKGLLANERYASDRRGFEIR
jgi:hypothetical protein